MLIGATLDSDRAWKFRPAPPFTSFVTICLCLLCWDLSQENPGPFQYGVITQSQAPGVNRHPENAVGPCVLLRLPETGTRPGCYLAGALDAVVGQVGLEGPKLSPAPYLYLRSSRLILKKYMMFCIPLEL